MAEPQSPGGVERPPDDELDRMYRRLLDELNIPESKRGSMLAQPMHMKWKLLSKHQRYVRVQSSSYGSYGGAVRSVQILDRILVNAEREGSNIGESSDIVDFRVEVKDDPDWVQVFLELGGVKKLVELLDVAAGQGETRVQTDLLECLLVLAKGNNGALLMLLDEFDAVTIIGACLPSLIVCEEQQQHKTWSDKLPTLVIHALNLIAESSADGHRAVMQSLEMLRSEQHEAMTFSNLMSYLRSDDSEMAFKARVIGFINVLLAGMERLENRVAMRSDLAYLGMVTVLDDLHGLVQLLLSEDSEGHDELNALRIQVEVFQNSAALDNKAVIEAAPVTGVWLADVDLLFAKVQDSARGAGAAKELTQLLHACLIIPKNAPLLAPDVWKLLAETSQRIVVNPDASTMSFAQVEQSYLAADDRFVALQIDEKKVVALEQELEETRHDLLALKKDTQALTVAHAKELQEMRTKHDKALELAKAAANAIPDPAENNISNAVPMAPTAVTLSIALAAKNQPNQKENQAASKTEVAPLAKFEKYASMKKAGLPELAIKNSLVKDGISKADQYEFFGWKPAEVTKLTANPKFAKYDNMLKCGLPEGAVRNAMVKDGLPENDQQVFFTEPKTNHDDGADQDEYNNDDEEEESKEDESIKNNPKFERYVKMQLAGLPEGAIVNAMVRDVLAVEDQDRFFRRGRGSKGGKKKKYEKNKNPKVAMKPKVEQRQPMRALFWSKLPNDLVEGTMWKDMNDSEIEFDIDALEKGFAQAAGKNKAKTSAGTSKSNNQVEDVDKKNNSVADNKPVELVDPSRRQNVGIAFARLKMSPQMLRTCIVEMDLKRLGGGVDRVKLLQSMVPTREEAKLLAEYSDDKERLGKIEQLFLELGSINNIGDVIKAWEIQLGFKQRVAETRETVETFSKACQEVKKSGALKQLLKVVLAVGNYLNGTTARGGAYGFKLDLLTKIETIKAADNKSTLLSYIVKEVIEKRYPAIMRLPKDLEHVEHAHRISLVVLIQTCNDHEGDIKFIKRVLANLVEDSTFATKTQQFLLGAEKSLSHLRAAADHAQATFEEVITVLAPGDEDIATNSEAFFEIFHRFLQSFTRELTPPEEKQRRKSHFQKSTESSAVQEKNKNKNKNNKPAMAKRSAGLNVLDDIKSRKGKASINGRVPSSRVHHIRPVEIRPINILDQIKVHGQAN